MGIFWRGLLAFSLSVNLAGAAIVSHHWMTTSHHQGCAAGCQWEAATRDLGGDGAPVENIESMRRSFETFREGCHGDMRELRQRLVTLILAEESDIEAMEDVLRAMGSRQVDLQRRLVEQILAERSALPDDSRQVFDGRLEQRLLGCTGCRGAHRAN